jgi:hypothetical protein
MAEKKNTFRCSLRDATYDVSARSPKNMDRYRTIKVIMRIAVVIYFCGSMLAKHYG